jgi:uracil-DNA glycosylase
MSKELESFGDHVEILPAPSSLVFNAFKLCHYPPKCVILGQDPYFSNLNEAMGLSFSVPDGVKVPVTLVNIFEELKTDLESFKIPKSGNLTKWSQEGIFLLNTALTVRYKQKETHLTMWRDFTNTIIELISEMSPTPIVFMLWGSHAKDRRKLIQKSSYHLILEATHPSPLGANKGGWFGSKHFSQCNQFLKKNELGEINWSLS